ncbi:MAG: histidine phosphatase family protein [Bacillus sp. (in: firmicutes)]
MEFNDTIHITLIRHGLTAYNVDKKYLGFTDEPVLRERLKDYEPLRLQLTQQPLSKIYSSDLRRCVETAEYLFAQQPIHLDKRLREMNFGDYEGKTYEQLKNFSQYRKWIDDWAKAGPPNGENGQHFRQRIQQFMQQLFLDTQLGEHIVIVSHGGVIRYIVSSLCDLPYWDVEVKHGTAISLQVSREGNGHACCNWWSI